MGTGTGTGTGVSSHSSWSSFARHVYFLERNGFGDQVKNTLLFGADDKAGLSGMEAGG